MKGDAKFEEKTDFLFENGHKRLSKFLLEQVKV